jgi:hypothetical protein
MHAYGLVYAQLRPSDPRGRRFRERARAFASDFEAWFDPTGGVIPFGRSLTYRFAAGGFWAALAFADEEALSWGRVKGLLLRHLRWWSRWPISDRDGVLSLGWTYRNPWMREEYNSAGSPYWAMKAFLPLALPESHPFWQAEEEPLEPRTSAQPRAGMLLSRDATQVVALNGGHGTSAWLNQGPAKYGRLVYSSLFGFSADSRAVGGRAGHDSTLVLTRAEDAEAGVGADPRERHVWEHFIEDDLVYCRWTPFEGVTVHSVLLGAAPWHLRLHRVRTDVPLRAEESGFALGVPSPEAHDAKAGRGEARAESAWGVSAIRCLHGSREAALRPLPPNANLVHPHAVVPLLGGDLDPGVHDLACAVYASDRPDPTLESSPPPVPPRARAVLDRMAPPKRDQ